MKRYITILLLFTLPLAFLGAEGKAEDTPVPVRVAALNGPTGLGMLHLFEEHPDLGPGLTFVPEVAPEPGALLPKLSGGDLEAAVVPSNMAALLAARDLPFRLGAVTGMGLLYLVTTDPAVTGLSSFAGGELSTVGKGATPDILTRYFLEQEGLAAGDDVVLDFRFTHPDLAKAVIGDVRTSAVLPEPFVTMVLAQRPDARIAADFQQLWTDATGLADYPMSALVVREDWAREYPEALDALLEAYEDSIDWVNSHAAEAGPLAQKHGFTLPPPVVSASIPRLNLRFQRPGEAEELLKAYYGVLYSYEPGSVGGRLPDDAFYGD